MINQIHEAERGAGVLIRTQHPEGDAIGEAILVHGLEGSSEAGYMRSAAYALLQAGFVTHRFNLRSCGTAEALCPTTYHAGQTVDLLGFLLELYRQGRTPAHLVGFSLGGNVALKLAGELAKGDEHLLASVCAVSPPIDLEACVGMLSRPENRIYDWRFVTLMKRRIRRQNLLAPEHFPLDGLADLRTLRDIDEQFTAPQFGFADASHYYSTQSASGYLESIAVPTLVIQAQDDPLIPLEVFGRRAFRSNPWLRLEITRHGGHLGYLSRERPRFWADEAIVEWFVQNQRNKTAAVGVHTK